MKNINNLTDEELENIKKEVQQIRKELDKHPDWGQHHHLEERITVIEEKLGITY